MQVSIMNKRALKMEEEYSFSSKKQEKGEKVPKAVKLNYWRPEEQRVYLEFLKEHMPMVTSVAYRKTQRIFKKISMRIGSRSPIQVKSHHQKLEDKYKTIPKIIAFLEESLKTQSKESTFQVEESVSTEQEPVVETVKVSDACMQVEITHYHDIVNRYDEPFFEEQFDESYIRVPILVEDESIFYF